jgi:hypothetical protein
MLFVSYAGTDGDISDTTVKWKTKTPNTLESVESLRKAVAEKVSEKNSHHIKIINWKRLKKE